MKKIIFIIILPIIVLITLYFASLYVYPQIPTVLAYKIAIEHKLSDSVDVIPTSHVISRVAPKQGTTYTLDGVSITTDWQEKQTRDTQHSRIIQFENDALIVLSSKQSEVNVYDYLHQKLAEESNVANVDTYFINSGIDSNQDLFEKMLFTARKSISIKQNMDQLTLNIVLLPIKAATLLDAEEVLTYSVNGITFYQFLPLNDNATYQLIFFDTLDTQRSLSIKKENISQQEIESLVQTIEIIN